MKLAKKIVYNSLCISPKCILDHKLSIMKLWRASGRLRPKDDVDDNSDAIILTCFSHFDSNEMGLWRHLTL